MENTEVADLVADIASVIEYAIIAHMGQTRRDTGHPYIVHPIAVMANLASVGVTDVDLLRAAVLHDVVEDCGLSVAELKTKWGKQTASLVGEVTNRPDLKREDKKAYMVEKIQCLSPPALLLKLADRLDNIKSLRKGDDWSIRYADETRAMLDPVRDFIADPDECSRAHRELLRLIDLKLSIVD